MVLRLETGLARTPLTPRPPPHLESEHLFAIPHISPRPRAPQWPLLQPGPPEAAAAAARRAVVKRGPRTAAVVAVAPVAGDRAAAACSPLACEGLAAVPVKQLQHYP